MISSFTQGRQTAAHRRVASTVAGLACAFAGLLLLASPAFANRTYVSKITGFSNPTSIAIDGSDNVWVSDRSGPAIYEYSSYPSQTLLDTLDGFGVWGGVERDLQLSVDNDTGELFVSQTADKTVNIFDHGVYSHRWNNINGRVATFNLSRGIRVAVDNSDTYSKGRVYLSLFHPENDVEVVDAAQRPVDLPASTGYIDENRLTGTPSGPFAQVGNIAVDSVGNLYVADTGNDVVDEFDSTGTFLRAFASSAAPAIDPVSGDVLIGVDEFDSSGNYLETLNGPGGESLEGIPAFNSNGYLYISHNDGGNGGGSVDIFTPNTVVPKITYRPISGETTTAGTLNAELEPNGGGNIVACKFEYGLDTSYGLGSLPCSPGTEPYTAPTQVSADLSSLTTETTYHYRVVVENTSGTKYGTDQSYTPHRVVGLSTEVPSNLAETSVTLNGSLVGDGTDTHYYFEWGRTIAYGNTTATPPGVDLPAPSGPSATLLSAGLVGLAPFSTYHYRIVATTGAGSSHGDDVTFTTPPGIPSISGESISAVHSDRAVLHAQINPNGADTEYHFEYVDDANFNSSGFANATKSTSEAAGMSRQAHGTSAPVDGLMSGTVYHYRAVATNEAGTGIPGVDRTFTTFPFGFSDRCPNAHVRQQTGAALLNDCRAYELVSAANAGGYDVESDLVSGQSPFGGYPEAENPSQVLYGVHDGGIPGTGNPTNRGVDPYVATRSEQGWNTRYVGIPANDPFAGAPFASTLDEADSTLDSFAFSGPNICSPCFEDHSTGVPVRRPSGELVQGMAGSIPQPTAEPAGFVGKRFSADGAHVVFGSAAKFEPDGNEGEISLYDRDLAATPPLSHVISKSTSGSNLACLMHCSTDGIGELDISADGSRIVLGQLISTDSAGNRYWHLYMNVGDSDKTIDLTPGATDGALYDGMTSDGSKVFFTSADPLITTADQDSDSSADIYRADVTASAATLTRISTGSAGNTDSCDPTANTIRPHWNSVDPDANCDAVAVGGGGGVASGDGTIYFLSPELLDGADNGVQNAPNLYVDRPEQAPHFVRTLESAANAPLPPPAHPLLRSFGSFSKPSGIAVDQSNGDVYVIDIHRAAKPQGDFVQKFDSSGRPVTSFANHSKLDGSTTPHSPFVPGFFEYGLIGLPTSIAVDNDPGSPSYRDLYVPDYQNHAVDKFDSSGTYISQFSANSPSGVAVDPSNGRLFIVNFSGVVDVYDANGNSVTSFSTVPGSTGIAVDTEGNVYVSNGAGPEVVPGKVDVFDSSGNFLRHFDAGPVTAVAVDSANDHVYVNRENRVVEFDSSGNQVGAPIGSGLISGSIGLAAYSDRLYVSNPDAGGNVDAFGPTSILPYPPADSPLVLDSVSSAGTRNSADFQVSPNGNDAIFTSVLPLTGYDNAFHREVYRYDAPADRLNCVSCSPTGEQSTGEATLSSSGGLSLSYDGRVFFNSTEGLVDRDLNGRMDVYEWDNGKIELISTGTSPLDSSLLGVSADGTDAYFFTREALVSTDQNGSNVRVYDARAFGGFPFVPAVVPCKASDECHGPGTQTPPPPNIKTIVGTSAGNATPRFASKHRSKRHHSKKHHKHHHKHRAGNNHGGTR